MNPKRLTSKVLALLLIISIFLLTLPTQTLADELQESVAANQTESSLESEPDAIPENAGAKTDAIGNANTDTKTDAANTGTDNEEQSTKIPDASTNKESELPLLIEGNESNNSKIISEVTE